MASRGNGRADRGLVLAGWSRGRSGEAYHSPSPMTASVRNSAADPPAASDRPASTGVVVLHGCRECGRHVSIWPVCRGRTGREPRRAPRIDAGPRAASPLLRLLPRPRAARIAAVARQSAGRVGPQRRTVAVLLGGKLEVPYLVRIDLAQAEPRTVAYQPVIGFGRADVDRLPDHVPGCIR